MFLKQLNLTNFRNYSQLNLSFDDRSTILLGNNGAGKSNILESVYLLATSKSLRADTEDELIKTGEAFARVEGIIMEDSKGDGETALLVIINAEGQEIPFRKKVLVNGVAKRTVDFIGNLPAVIFYPSDINLITGSPSLRRWHLDLGLAQIDPTYKKSLTLYEQFLTSRNRVLKRIREGFAKIDELDYWNNGVVENGKVISEKRRIFFEFINNMTQSLGEFKFEYKQSFPFSDEKGKQSLLIEEWFQQNSAREVAAAATLIGPHRDDFSIILEGKNIAHFGSRGEQRTATLSFKLSQLEYMAKVLGKRPVLLLDDVFSELDANHRAAVVEIVSKQQTIIATVELENIPKEFLNSSRILNVENGEII